MNWALTFMWAQVVLCTGGALGYAYQGQWSMAWVWFCYSLANIGWVGLAGGFK